MKTQVQMGRDAVALANRLRDELAAAHVEYLKAVQRSQDKQARDMARLMGVKS